MNEFRIKTYPVGQVVTNCYIIYKKNKKDQADNNQAIVVDPGDNAALLLNKFRELEVRPEAILLTHGHFDHIMAVNDIRRAFPEIKIYIGEREQELAKDPNINLSASFGQGYSVEGDVYVKDGERLSLAGLDILVIATPGHTAGSVCFLIEEEQVLISGDTLFQESLGRTDFPTGDTVQIIKSIKERLFTLPEDTMVYPGHGEPSTIGYEKQHNPVARYKG